MLKPTLNKLTIPDSILIYEFIVTNYCMVYSIILSLTVFFIQQMPKKHGKNNSCSPKIFATVVNLGVFSTLVFHESFKIS